MPTTSSARALHLALAVITSVSCTVTGPDGDRTGAALSPTAPTAPGPVRAPSAAAGSSAASPSASDAGSSAVAPPGSAAADPSAGAHARTQHVQVKSLADGHGIAGSSATLTRRPEGLSVRVHTRAFHAGEPVEVLWAVFNHPEACVNPNPLTGAACSPPDLFVAGTGGSLHYAATLAADHHGKLAYAASLETGSLAGCVGDPFPCNTLKNPAGAEVHSAMFTPGGGPGRQAAQFLPR